MTLNAAPGPTRVYLGLDDLLYNPSFGLSNSIVNELRIAGFPTLLDDRVLFGWAELKDRRAAPSIVCIWDGSGSTGAEYLREFPQPGTVNLQPIIPSVATDLMRLSWHCWGVASPQSPAGNASAARFLCHTIWRVIETAAHGSVITDGIDTDPEAASEHGFQATLRTTWRTPVPGALMAYLLPGTNATATVSADGETAATIAIPKVT